MRIVILPILAAFIAITALSGCGVKPRAIDPPASVIDDTFPQTYPDPATDPKPKYKAQP